MAKRLPPDVRIKKANIWLMSDPRTKSFSGVLMVGSSKVEKNVPTAHTNGYNVVYGEAFVNKLNEPELRGLVLHENLHKVCRHISLYKTMNKDNARLANIAQDIYINNLILDMDPSGKDIDLPVMSQDDKNFIRGYKGKSVDYIYRDLKSKCKTITINLDGLNIDVHMFCDEDGNTPLTPEQLQEVERALRQGQAIAGNSDEGNGRGSASGGILRDLLDAYQPKVKWQDILQEYLTTVSQGNDESSWRKPNRRHVANDFYMPTSVVETMGVLVVAVDTSGSISQVALSKFFTEIESIANDLKPEMIKLIYWDSEVAGVETYELGNYDGMRESTKPAGGGGTCVSSVPKYLQEHKIEASCAVVFTDGCVEPDFGANHWNELGLPTIWCITSEDVISPIGMSVHVDLDE